MSILLFSEAGHSWPVKRGWGKLCWHLLATHRPPAKTSTIGAAPNSSMSTANASLCVFVNLGEQVLGQACVEELAAAERFSGAQFVFEVFGQDEPLCEQV